MIRPKRSVRGAAATIALTSGISVVAPAVIGSVAHAANTVSYTHLTLPTIYSV